MFEDYEEVIVVYSWNLNPVFSRLLQWNQSHGNEGMGDSLPADPP